MLLSITINDILNSSSATLSGLFKMYDSFFNSLWDNPMGQIMLVLSLVSGAILIGISIYNMSKIHN